MLVNPDTHLLAAAAAAAAASCLAEATCPERLGQHPGVRGVRMVGVRVVNHVIRIVEVLA